LTIANRSEGSAARAERSPPGAAASAATNGASSERQRDASRFSWRRIASTSPRRLGRVPFAVRGIWPYDRQIP
jgi:hypothetical protein